MTILVSFMCMCVSAFMCEQFAHAHAWVWFISMHMKNFKLVALEMTEL